MSQFFSDLITLTTLSVTGGAIALGSLTGSPGDVPAAQTDADMAVLVVQAPREAAVTPVTNTPRPALPQVAAASFDDIPQAQLLQVSFTSTAEDLFPSRAATNSAARGTVTGNTVNLRAGPGTGFAVAGRAVRDQQLEVTGEKDGIWIQVYAEGVADPVWIHGKFFRAP